MQRYIHARGGDRSIYRVAYTPAAQSGTSSSSRSGISKAAPAAASSSSGSPSTAVIEVTRYFEYLRPADGDGLRAPLASAQADIAPMKSTSPTVNAALAEASRRLVPYVEHNLRGRVLTASLDFVFDEREQPHFLWPTEVRVPDPARRRASLAGKALEGAGATLSGSSASASDGAHNNNRRGSAGSVGDGWPASTAVGPMDLAAAIDSHPALAGGSGSSGVTFRSMDPSQREAEAAVLAQHAALLDQTVGDGARGRILLVDADAHTALTATHALVNAGYAVTVSNDGPKSLALTRRTVFDCLLIGKRLPSLSAVEVTRMIRQRETTLTNAARGLAATSSTSAPPYLPIVVLTSETGPDDLRVYMEAGMDGCVAKPLDVPTLLGTMGAAIPNPPPSATRGHATAAALSSGESLRSPTPRGSPTGTPVALAAPRSPGDVTVAAYRPQHSPGGRSGGGTPQGTGTPQGREGMAGAANALFGDEDVTAYMQDRSLGHGDEGGGGGGLAAEPSLIGGGSVAPGAQAQPKRRSSQAGGAATGSPYKQDQTLSLKRSSLRRGSIGKQSTVGRGGPALRGARGMASIAAAASGGKPGLVVLPAGAAIPGIPPPAFGGSSGANATSGPSVAAGGMAGVPTIPVNDDPDGARLGVFQLDSATSLPFCVMGTPRPGVPLFHLVIIGDFFETYESYQILLRKSVARLPGLRVLLFNLPGQAYTEWRRDVVLNNEYLAGCLQALLTYVGPAGTREFDLDGGDAAWYLVGAGNGAMIASYFASAYHAAYPNLRGIVSVNGFGYVDAHLAAVLHDCVNVFSCTPPSRSDLPVYFFARFLFSPAYLAKVGAPLALNLHTAVFNPITLEGRTALCRGALSHVDVRDSLADLPLPFICVSSSADGLVRPAHTAALVEARGGEVRSIKRALLERARACVVWLRAGHEVFQEARKPMVNLLEQLATGFHESNDVTFLPLAEEDAGANLRATAAPGGGLGGSLISRSLTGTAAQLPPPSNTALGATAAARGRAAAMTATAAAIADGSGSGNGGLGEGSDRPLEDRFLDSIMRTMRTGSTVQTAPFGQSAAGGGYMGHGRPSAQVSDVPDSLHFQPDVPDEVRKADRAAKMAAGASKGRAGGRGRSVGKSPTRGGGAAAADPESDLLLDASLTSFERRDEMFAAARARAKRAGGGGPGASSSASSVLSGGAQYALPEIKEYMGWRIKRNRKRLARIEACATSIQRCWRSFLARTLVMRMRQQRSCVSLQSWWRGIMARRYVLQLRRELWGAVTIQRSWRGYYARILTERLREERRASTMVQKNWKGYRTRRFVGRVRALRSLAATKVQALVRRWRAQKLVWRMRDQRNAATNVQRVYRGHLGRKRAVREREKFLFSKSQAQGIEFARQMLMEHKLHATKLQSEVALLSKEKLAAEEAVEGLLGEIGAFETGTQSLERQMLDLSRAEAEAAGTLDEGARGEIREAKIRLDREFSLMLSRIADRREQLSELEAKLRALEHTRGAKKGELRDLERKLVVLLEQQQGELAAIRARQDRRGENVVEDAIEAVTAALQGRDPGLPGSQYRAGGGAPQLTNGGAGAGGAQLLLGDGSGNSTGGALVAGLGSHGGMTTAGGRGQSAHGGAGVTPAGVTAAAMGGPTPQQRAEAAALMSSTETMMKFGFMSMSLTYFSSLNMIKAMKQLGTANTALAGNPMLTMLGQMGAVATAGGDPSAAAAALGAAQGVSGAGRARGEGEVSLWTVGDVGSWLDSVCLGQYKDAFADAAIDGAFLCELTEEDMRNTLGIEHALHRKKLLSCIARLRGAEEVARIAHVHAATGVMPGGDGGMGVLADGPGSMTTTTGGIGGRRGSAGPGLTGAALRAATALHGTRAATTAANPSGMLVAAAQQERTEGAAAQRAAARDAGILRLDELMSWVRHNKGKLVAEAVASVPDGRFDPAYVRDPYVPDVGTVYVDVLNGPAFHVNKGDDKGNTLLIVAAQNGRLKLAQLLVRKGANANHQNVQGNTALHFAMAYKFHDVSTARCELCRTSLPALERLLTRCLRGIFCLFRPCSWLRGWSTLTKVPRTTHC